MSVRTVPGALDILNQKLGGNAGDIPASSTKEYALEKIYRTLGGEETLEGVNTTSEIIEKIAGVAEGGGGGSSDFSTAEVTFIKNAVSATIQFPHLIDNNIIMAPEADEDTYIVPIPNNGTTAGQLVISTDYSDVQGSGSVIIQQIPGSTNYFISITGNCSITIVA